MTPFHKTFFCHKKEQGSKAHEGFYRALLVHQQSVCCRYSTNLKGLSVWTVTNAQGQGDEDHRDRSRVGLLLAILYSAGHLSTASIKSAFAVRQPKTKQSPSSRQLAGCVSHWDGLKERVCHVLHQTDSPQTKAGFLALLLSQQTLTWHFFLCCLLYLCHLTSLWWQQETLFFLWWCVAKSFWCMGLM